MEMRTVALAALRRSETEAATLVGHARAMAANFDDPPNVMAHDVAFHETIATACRNPVFALITGALTAVMRETWAVGWQARPNDAERWLNVNCHNAIADAIKAGDPQAASAGIVEHYDHSTKALVAAGIG